MNSASQPSWSTKWPNLVGYLTIAVLMFGMVFWGANARISGAILAAGRIETAQARQLVEHPTGGVVEKILVSDGASVKAGDVVLRLDDAELRSELAVIDNQYFELLARRGRLEAERDARNKIVFAPELVERGHINRDVHDAIMGQIRLFNIRIEAQNNEAAQYRERVRQITSQIAGLQAQLTAQRKQIKLVSDELGAQEILFKKRLAQVSHISGLRRELVRLQGALGATAASIAQAKGRKSEAELEKLRASSKRRENASTRLRDLKYRELELAENRGRVKAMLDALEIRAPVSGKILGLQIHTVGAVVRAAEPLMYVIPQDRPLIIASKLAPVYIDQVHLGQEVLLRFPAFDRRMTPQLRGIVSNISADAIVDEVTQMSFYKIEIALDPTDHKALTKLQLLPGMPVQSYMKTADRAPISFLVKPVTDFFHKSFRGT